MTIYLSGCVRPEIADGHRPDLGLLLQPNVGNRPDVTRCAWAVDNGCFTRPDTYSDERFLRWLASWPEAPLFAPVPDVVRITESGPVGDAAATLARWRKSEHLRRELGGLGIPRAFVAQDGQERLPVPWDEAEALFIGGSTEWKERVLLGAFGLIREAKARGLWVHVGRVNSFRRLRLAHEAGADSADGNYIGFGPSVNLPKVEAWLDAIAREPRLFVA